MDNLKSIMEYFVLANPNELILGGSVVDVPIPLLAQMSMLNEMTELTNINF